jgi:hypothetical protein
MKEPEAFILALLMLIGATVVARKFLSRDARLALGVVAAVLHLA